MEPVYFFSRTRRCRSRGEIRVDKFKDEFGRVDVCWNWMPYAREVVNDLRYRAEVARSALGEQTQVVEKVEGCCRRLMNAGNDDELRNLSKVSFPSSFIVQSTLPVSSHLKSLGDIFQ